MSIYRKIYVEDPKGAVSDIEVVKEPVGDTICIVQDGDTICLPGDLYEDLLVALKEAAND